MVGSGIREFGVCGLATYSSRMASFGSRLATHGHVCKVLAGLPRTRSVVFGHVAADVTTWRLLVGNLLLKE